MKFDLSKPYCKYFDEMAKIPHGSFNEKALSDYLVKFAKDHKYKYVQDKMGNVIIYAPGTKGYEKSAPLMLQAHMDMVCEANKDTKHDFKKDPLKLYVDGNLLKAKGTTLGADDCAGVAYMLAILDDKKLKHTALECVFTVQEEVGLMGSMNIKKKDIKSERCISLDGGGETSTCLTSAGGCRMDIHFKTKYVANKDATYCMSIRGLAGGHSGGEIHKEKGNANKLATRVMKEAILNGVKVNIVSIDGGSKDNAIPRENDIVFASSTPVATIQKSLKASLAAFKVELEFSDKDIDVQLKKVTKASKVLSEKASTDLINMMFISPNGFKHRSMAIEGLTLTSLNMGVVKTTPKDIVITYSIRSAIESGIDTLVNELATIAGLYKCSYDVHARYPGWNFRAKSPMRDTLRKTVKSIYKKELQEIAVHGGNECGVWCALNPKMDIVTLGPMAAYIHTPDEQLDLASFDRTYKLLTSYVSAIK